MTYQRWREAFASAIDERLYTIEHLDGLLYGGLAQAWFGDEAAMVTEIRTYPTGARVIHGLVAAGDLAEICDVLIPRAEAWARSIGCILAIIESRPGWAKALRTSGYEPHQLNVRKELQDGIVQLEIDHQDLDQPEHVRANERHADAGGARLADRRRPGLCRADRRVRRDGP